MAYIKGFIWFFTTAFEGGIVLFHRQEVRDQGPTTSYKWYVNIIIGTCSVVKESTVQETKETRVQSLGWKDPLEKGMATHSSILAWRVSMDRGAWCTTAHGFSKSWTRLSNWAQQYSVYQQCLMQGKIQGTASTGWEPQLCLNKRLNSAVNFQNTAQNH